MDASQNRVEFKFVLPPGLGEVVRKRVGEMLVADRGAENGYPVLSEYFDTRERASYWQKQFGVPNRRRVPSCCRQQSPTACMPAGMNSRESSTA